MHKFFVVLIVGGATLAGSYAIAATIASSMAPAFNTAEPLRHSRIGEFAGALKRASVERRDARQKCEHVADRDKSRCDAHAIYERMRAKTEARAAYNAALLQADDTVTSTASALQRIDLILYRAHRQFP